MNLLSKILGVKVIHSPKAGFLVLLHDERKILLLQDQNAFKGFFLSAEVSTDIPPQCDVLFLYCDVENNGSIVGSPFGLQDIIRKSRAKIVVVASNNNGENYLSATQGDKLGVNLVMTIDRKGEAFFRFFSTLFSQMFKEVSMPQAWVKLAPQNPEVSHADCPETIFVCQAGQITFSQ